MKQHRLLLCTDMDRTVIPNGVQSEHPDARKRFRSFCGNSEVTLTYVTGRHKTLVQQAIKNYHLPEPDYAITDVGTMIYKIIDHEWIELIAWGEDIAQSWQGKSRQELRDLLQGVESLILQESHKQNTYKLSYYLPLVIDKDRVIAEVDSILKQNGIAASLIWSVDEAKNIGLLDVLPANATKLHAVEFLQSYLGYPDEEVLFAGDSGNDLPVLMSSIQSVLVANASDEIKQLAQQLSREQGNTASLFIAKPDACGMNANYAAGVLEGVWHYAVNFRDLLTKHE